jgi:membrane protein implicated in regulation of membrane protease activity
MLDNKSETKWHSKLSTLIIALLCVGPLALPLLWFNPRFSKKVKIIVSAIVIILTYYLVVASIDSIKAVSKLYQEMSQQAF